jgi:dipeptidyl aminopeptidase/acylaminoacyl peptidase
LTASILNGDAALRWPRDGRELFYLYDTRLTAVPIRSDKGLDSGAPRALFETPDVRSFAVSPDGRRFLLVRNVKREPLTRIVLALGAATEIGEPRKPKP